MIIDKKIFRAYDIRGVVDENFNKDTLIIIGRALGTKIKSYGLNNVIIGRDGRLSGYSLSNALSSGLQASGCNVIDIGMVPTPVLYFASKYLHIKSAVMVTGSHNPINFNGLKIIINDVTIYDNQIQELYRIICKKDFAIGNGKYCRKNINNMYMKAVQSDISIKKSLKIIVDCGNGVAGAIAPMMYNNLGCNVIPLYCKVDGKFPNHHPDPGNPENLHDLITAVMTHKADVGLAFDGDGDRLGIVDNHGKIIWPDRIAMLFAKHILQHHHKSTIIYDVKCSIGLHKVISQFGGNPLMWKTGHSLIKAKIKETNAVLAAEMSGHIFFSDRWYGFDDGLYAGARLLEILSKTNMTTDKIFAEYPEQVSTPEINIVVNEDKKFSIVHKLIETAKFINPCNIINIDGIRVEFANGWGLIRPSNTTPSLIARFEAQDIVALNQIKNQFLNALQKVAPELSF